MSRQSATADGNLDGSGYTYPAEEMPTPGLFVSGGVNWTMPSCASARKNNVTGTGQTITVPAGSCTELHILGSATAGNVTGTVTLNHTDGTSTAVTLNLTDWGRTPAFGEQVAVCTTHRHGTSGDQALKVRVFHQQPAVTGTEVLTSFTLPVAARLHVFAVTVK